jgi:hypothetical protein
MSIVSHFFAAQRTCLSVAGLSAVRRVVFIDRFRSQDKAPLGAACFARVSLLTELGSCRDDQSVNMMRLRRYQTDTLGTLSCIYESAQLSHKWEASSVLLPPVNYGPPGGPRGGALPSGCGLFASQSGVNGSGSPDNCCRPVNNPLQESVFIAENARLLLCGALTAGYFQRAILPA